MTAILTIENRHLESCGEPPSIRSGDYDYTSYFEGVHGDQWIFVYDLVKDKATVYGGDIQWDEPWDEQRIMKVIALPWAGMATEEKAWVTACMLVVFGRYRTATAVAPQVEP